eukprot:8079510-Pyramimonas_sp.AAC.1
MGEQARRLEEQRQEQLQSAAAEEEAGGESTAAREVGDSEEGGRGDWRATALPRSDAPRSWPEQGWLYFSKRPLEMLKASELLALGVLRETAPHRPDTEEVRDETEE